MEEPLKEGDNGCYSELASRRVDDELVLIFMPTLAALLGHAEQLKGTSLSETEVVRIRDQAIVVATRPDVAHAVARQRGYADIDGADPWRSRQEISGANDEYMRKTLRQTPA